MFLILSHPFAYAHPQMESPDDPESATFCSDKLSTFSLTGACHVSVPLQLASALRRLPKERLKSPVMIPSAKIQRKNVIGKRDKVKNIQIASPFYSIFLQKYTHFTGWFYREKVCFFGVANSQMKYIYWTYILLFVFVSIRPVFADDSHKKYIQVSRIVTYTNTNRPASFKAIQNVLYTVRHPRLVFRAKQICAPFRPIVSNPLKWYGKSPP